MSQFIPKRLLLGAVALGAVAALAACEEPRREPAPAPAPVVEPETPAAEDAAAPTAAEAPDTPPTAPVEALPPDRRSSEETVQPESDTLFY